MRRIGCALSSLFEFHTSKMKIPNETDNAFQNRDLAAKGHIANVQVRLRDPRSFVRLVPLGVGRGGVGVAGW